VPDDQIYARTRLQELIDRRAVDIALDWLDIHREQSQGRASSTAAAGDWQQPEPLQGALPPVQAFSGFHNPPRDGVALSVRSESAALR
jgi:hypothetical protein